MFIREAIYIHMCTKLTRTFVDRRIFLYFIYDEFQSYVGYSITVTWALSILFENKNYRHLKKSSKTISACKVLVQYSG